MGVCKALQKKLVMGVCVCLLKNMTYSTDKMKA